NANVARCMKGAGLTRWQSREDLTRSRRRVRSVIGGLSALAALWLPALFSAKGNAVAGGVILEAFTLAPLMVAAFRARHLSRLVKRVDTMAEEDQQAEAAALKLGDELIWRLGLARQTRRRRIGGSRRARDH